jgi:hypothetical protein
LKRLALGTCGPFESNGIASENTAPRLTSRAAAMMASAVM